MWEVESFLEEACGFSSELFDDRSPVNVNRKVVLQVGNHQVHKHLYLVVTPDLAGINLSHGLILGGKHL